MFVATMESCLFQACLAGNAGSSAVVRGQRAPPPNCGLDWGVLDRIRASWGLVLEAWSSEREFDLAVSPNDGLTYLAVGVESRIGAVGQIGWRTKIRPGSPKRAALTVVTGRCPKNELFHPFRRSGLRSSK